MPVSYTVIPGRQPTIQPTCQPAYAECYTNQYILAIAADVVGCTKHLQQQWHHRHDHHVCFTIMSTCLQEYIGYLYKNNNKYIAVCVNIFVYFLLVFVCVCVYVNEKRIFCLSSMPVCWLYGSGNKNILFVKQICHVACCMDSMQYSMLMHNIVLLYGNKLNIDRNYLVYP